MRLGGVTHLQPRHPKRLDLRLAAGGSGGPLGGGCRQPGGRQLALLGLQQLRALRLLLLQGRQLRLRHVSLSDSALDSTGIQCFIVGATFGYLMCWAVKVDFQVCCLVQFVIFVILAAASTTNASSAVYSLARVQGALSRRPTAV